MKNQTTIPSHFLVATIVWLMVFCHAFPAAAQDRSSNKKKEIPPPETVMLVSKDRVEVRATYFPGMHQKESPCAILVHDWGRSRADLLPMAQYLQKEKGCAVIVPDLRGHGESVSVQGLTEPLNYEDFKRAEIETMWLDIDACRKFLQDQNDEGLLNLDMLTVVAVGKIAPIAVFWCADDWRWPPIGGVKQGQNVKGLVLISPERRLKGVSMSQLIKHPLFSGGIPEPLAVLIYWGRNHTTANREAEAIYKAMSRGRPKVDEKVTGDESLRQKSLFRVSFRSSLAGQEFLDRYASDIYSGIAKFIEIKIIERKDEFRWQKRNRD